MNKNKILKEASLTCTVLSYMLLAVIIIGTIVLIHWHYDRELYRSVKVSEGGGVYFSGEVGTKPDIRLGHGSVPNKISISELEPLELYILYVQGVIRMFFLFLIFREFGRVIKSVKALQTFKTDNIETFRKIGKYFLVLFWCSGIHFSSIKSNVRLDYHPELTPLILMLAAYVLAEIFKEGNRIYEEEQLTV